MKTYGLLVFDFDGTLVDTAPDIAHHANATLAEFGFPPKPLGDVKRAIGKGVHVLLKGLAPELDADPDRLEKAVLSFRARYAGEPVLTSKPYPGVVEALEGPLARVKKAIATNKPHEITLQILKILGLQNHFEAVIGMGASFPPKPEPDSLFHIMKMLKAEAAETVFVGDSAVDAETARRAGVDFAWVDYGYDDTPPPAWAVARCSHARDWGRLAS